MADKNGWLWLACGAAVCFVAIAMGAMGSHMIDMTPDRAATFATASDYQMWHGLAISLVALWRRVGESRVLALATWMFLAGIILFCVPLYLITIAGAREFGALAPIGGTLLLGGWLLVVIGAVNRARS